MVVRLPNKQDQKLIFSLLITFGAMELTLKELYESTSGLLSLIMKTENECHRLKRLYNEVISKASATLPPAVVLVTPTGAKVFVIDSDDDDDDTGTHKRKKTDTPLNFKLSGKVHFPVADIMKLDPDDRAISCYIFGDGLLGGRTLVEYASHHCTRKELNDLRPGKWLGGHILTAVACKVMVRSRGWSVNRLWYLPSHFEDLVVRMDRTPKKVVSNFQNTYLGATYQCDNIYLPMNEDNSHWFLVVVSMKRKEVDMLDSLPNVERVPRFKKRITRMLRFLYDMLDQFPDKSADYKVPKVHQFSVKFPDVCKQLNSGCCTVMAMIISIWRVPATKVD